MSMNATIYAKDGSQAGTVDLPAAIFGAEWNADLVHEVVVAMQANARANTAHTKDRSEVSGGGKKPWRQKGTGRARHGSRRSPIWAGGGVTHGPRNDRNFTKKINKKAKAKALASVLSKKYTDGEVIFVDAFGLMEPKTAAAKQVLTAIATGSGHEDLATKRQNTALIALTKRDDAVEKSFRNFGNVEVAQVKDINPVQLLTYKYVIVAEPTVALEALQSRVAAITSSNNE